MSMESRFFSCYNNWIHIQKSDLTKLIHASSSSSTTDAQLRNIIEQSLKHYEDYSEQRKVLSQEDGPTFLSPPWCASFENSVLWIGGCRPSIAIRLLYSVTGSDMETHLEEFLQGEWNNLSSIGLMGLTANQLQLVNDLHQRTLHAEDRLSARLASLQEDVADKPLLPIVRERLSASSRNAYSSSSSSSSVNITSNGNIHDGVDVNMEVEVEVAMKSYADGLGSLVTEADRLRVATTRTLLTEILSPRQAVEYLVAAKQLHLSLHDWAIKRDRQLRRS